MELPFLSLSKQRRTKPIIYGDPTKPTIQVYAPEKTGIANISDWDIIIYCAAHIRAALNAGEPTSQRVRIVPAEYLRATRRHNGKKYQDGITDGLRRLKATQIETSIRLEDQRGSFKKDGHFSWINDYWVTSRIINMAGGPKEIVEHYELELCSWLYQAILNTSLVLTLDSDYFLLDGGYERWLYRLVRKSAGRGEWTWTLAQLYERSGQGEPYNKFAFHIREIVKRADADGPLFLGYALALKTVTAKGRKPEPALTARYTGQPSKDIAAA
jgi:plasmid replication initiation protein